MGYWFVVRGERPRGNVLKRGLAHFQLLLLRGVASVRNALGC